MPDKIEFKRIAEEIDISEVARYLGITIGKDHRGNCPGCADHHERNLELKPESNTFICFTGQPRPGTRYLSGDCITLYAHVRGYQGQYKAAKELQDAFMSNAPAEPPQKKTTEARTEKETQPRPTSKKVAAFDPDKFAASLEYTPEVEALGLTEEDATKFKIGVHRGKLYVPLCPADSMPPAWVEFSEGELKLPSKWLAPSNVVPLKRPA